MTEAVLDASALIAFILGEPGADKVAAVARQSCISAVNLCETLAKPVEYNKNLDEVTHQVERLQISVVPFDQQQAGAAASLRKVTRPYGLSLGDRACLALAMQTSLPAFTTERTWSKCGIGARIVTIR